MATLSLPFLTVLITALAVAVGLAILVIFVRTLRDTKTPIDSAVDTSK